MRSFLKNKIVMMATGIFLVSLVLTSGLSLLVRNSVDQQLSAQFQNQTDQITSLVQDRMNLYTNVVYGAQGLFAASQSVKKNEWTAYIQKLNLAQNYSGISGMTYIERVPASARNLYPNKIYPDSDKNDYYPITYTGTSTVNTTSSGTTTAQSSIGFDASSDPVRFQAMSRAAETDTPIASGVVLTITTHLPAFGIYAPIYTNSALHSNVSERSAALMGFVSVSFRVTDLFEGLTSDPIFDKNIDLSIYDAPNLGKANASELLFGGGTPPGNLSRISHVTVGGRVWTLSFSALPTYTLNSVESDAPLAVLLVGIILSFLLSWLIYSLASSRENALTIAKKITEDLESSKEELQKFLDGLSTFVAKIAPDARFLFANAAAKTASGMGEKLIGADFINGPWFAYNPAVISRTREAFKKVLRGELINYDEQLQIQSPSGPQVVSINFSMIPVRIGGEIKYIIAEGRDISTNKKVEDELRNRTADLERVNRLMLDREVRMSELKDEMKTLKK